MAFPRFTAVADHAVLAEFAETITPQASEAVRQLDAKLAAAPFAGFVEAVPAYVSLLVIFDPVVSDHVLVEASLRARLAAPKIARAKGRLHAVEVCYDADLAPDLGAVAEARGMTVDAVIAAHLSGRYSVALYGFAPGYAYLSGVPASLDLPRKPRAVRAVPAGSVIIAGAQCIVTTLTMPTGWWIIGRSPTRILRDDPARPFLFDVGDAVRFRRIDRATFDAGVGGGLA